MIKIEPARSIEAEAVSWVARFDAGDVSPEDQVAFQAWLNCSPRHREIFAEHDSLWSKLDALRRATDIGQTGQ